MPPLFVLILGGAVLAVIGITVFTGKDEAPEGVALADATATGSPNASSSDGSAEGSSRSDPALPADWAQPGNDIEAALEATVFIRTQGSTGSGFFADAGCAIVTNRHVVQADEVTVDALYGQMEKAEQAVAAAKTRLDNRAAAFNASCTDCSKASWQRSMGRDLNLFESAKAMLVDLRRTILDAEHGGQVTVVLADEREYPATIDRVSPTHDLALLRIEADDCPYLTFGSEDDLRHGDPLFTVGSPMGIQHKVTAGVFSGFVEGDQQLSEERMIQTDAPINPGNSGGPLITPDGLAVGVNTAILSNSEGIGFAIPISVVERELGPF